MRIENKIVYKIFTYSQSDRKIENWDVFVFKKRTNGQDWKGSIYKISLKTMFSVFLQGGKPEVMILRLEKERTREHPTYSCPWEKTGVVSNSPTFLNVWP